MTTIIYNARDPVGVLIPSIDSTLLRVIDFGVPWISRPARKDSAPSPHRRLPGFATLAMR